MQKFTFLGTPECPDEIMLRDTVFAKGVAVEIQDADFIRKLSRLSYFAQDAVITEPKKRGRPRKVIDVQDGD